MNVVGVVVLYAAWEAHSVALAGFGLDSLIEMLEERASRISSYLLYALALYVVLQSGYGLLHRYRAETTFIGMAVAVAAALGMPMLAKAKLRIADAIGSKALRADAMETLTCGFCSRVWAQICYCISGGSTA